MVKKMSNLNEFSHFLQRVYERYKLTLTLSDLTDIAEKIKSGKAKLIGANARGFRYKVRFNKQLLVVVLNRSHSIFITALPLAESNQKVKFNNRNFTYEDALFINYQFHCCFNRDERNKVICPKCGSRHIIVNLGKDRFQCENCKNIIKFIEPEFPEITTIQVLTPNGFEQRYDLSFNLWWYLYKTNRTWSIDNDTTIKAKLVDNDRFTFGIINHINNMYYKKYITIGYYTKQEIKGGT